MRKKLLPRYPIYVISKGRADCCYTAQFLMKDGCPFHLVVEPQEAEEYISRFGVKNVYVLPFSNLGLGGIPARNWVWEHAKAAGHERHWILDDNIRGVLRRFKAKRLYCNSLLAFCSIEDFVDRYENIAIAGMNYDKFACDYTKMPPFVVNNHVYSNLLIQNDLPYRWRGRYNEDTDLCLQVLSGGLCTVLTNVFLVKKECTMVMKGGNSDELYKGDGRLKMARSLERLWPGVVETKRRFQRPQHVIKNAWGKFDTPLIKKKSFDPSTLEKTNEYGMELKEVAPIKSKNIKRLLLESQKLNKKGKPS